jgi:hypothetical protein
MARRKRKQSTDRLIGVGLLVLAGGLGLAGQNWQLIPPGASADVAAVILAISAGIAAYPLMNYVTRQHELQLVLQRVEMLTDRHLEWLASRRAKSVRFDEDGNPQFNRWAREICNFITDTVEPTMRISEREALAANYNLVVELISNKVERALDDVLALPAGGASDP